MCNVQRELNCAKWRKSSHSGSGDQCVEVAPLSSGIRAVRDSKDVDGPVLLFAMSEWHQFIGEIKARR